MNNLQVIEHSNQRVLLTSQIAEAYGTIEKVISNNFNRNKERYQEGKHFYILQGEGLQELKNCSSNLGAVGGRTSKLYLWAEKGALLHAKSPELQMFSQMFQAVANQEMKVNQLEVKQEETSKKLDTALDIFTSAIEPNWKTQINSKINQICKEHRLNYCMVRRDLYSELENAAKCNLSARVRNHQARLKKSGALYKEISAVTKIDVIANDCKFQAIFDGIVKKFQAKYVQGDNVQEGLDLERRLKTMCKYIECDGKCSECNMLTAMGGCKCGSYLSCYGCDDCPYREEVASHETSQEANT